MRLFIAPVAGLAALATLYMLSPASAKTEAECKQGFAAREAAGETGGESRASYVKACLAPERTSADPEPKTAASDSGGHDDDTSLAKKTENPIADLSVPFNNYSTFNYGGRGTFNLLEIQPVIPIHLTPDWNVVTRTVVPVVWTPGLSPPPSVPVGRVQPASAVDGC